MAHLAVSTTALERAMLARMRALLGPLELPSGMLPRVGTLLRVRAFLGVRTLLGRGAFLAVRALLGVRLGLPPLLGDFAPPSAGSLRMALGVALPVARATVTAPSAIASPSQGITELGHVAREAREEAATTVRATLLRVRTMRLSTTGHDGFSLSAPSSGARGTVPLLRARPFFGVLRGRNLGYRRRLASR